jgi:hypothetical protein
MLPLAASALFWAACVPSEGTKPGEDSLEVRNRADEVVDTTGLLLSQDDGSAKYVEGQWTEEKAMAVVYGLYDKGMECSKWVCKPSERKSFGDKIDDQGMLYTRAAGHFQYKTSEGNKVLLLTETLSREAGGWEECHACAPIVGLAEFTELEGDWFVQGLRKDLETMGSWGQLPPNELVQVGPDNFAVMFEPGYLQMGILESKFVVAGIVDGKFEVVLDVEASYSNEGYYFEDFFPEKAYSFESSTEWKKGSNPSWYDLIITTKGKRPISGKEDGDDIREFVEKSTYKFENGKYVLEDKVTDVN